MNIESPANDDIRAVIAGDFLCLALRKELAEGDSIDKDFGNLKEIA